MHDNFESLIGKTVRKQLSELIPELTQAVSLTVIGLIKESFPKEENHLTTQDVCRMFNIHPQTANRWRRNGRLPYHTTPGRKIYYIQNEIMGALKDKRAKFNLLN
ncbi:MAG: helix-turn-helix domain-containing protein [Bacteroidetes bacterium]|nr:helix-turn-helix domain-containing protein [Bacteroidota bacterium]